MFQNIEREFKSNALPLFLAVVAIAIILKSFLTVMDRRPSNQLLHDNVESEFAEIEESVSDQMQPQTNPRVAPSSISENRHTRYRQSSAHHQAQQTDRSYQTHPDRRSRNPHVATHPGSRGRQPASIGPSHITGLRYQPRAAVPAIGKKNSSILAKTIGSGAANDLKEILSGEDRTRHFLQRELNLSDSDLQMIKDEKMRVYSKLRELDRQNDPAKTQQERTSILQQHKSWMESVIGPENYQRLQVIRGI